MTLEKRVKLLETTIANMTMQQHDFKGNEKAVQISIPVVVNAAPIKTAKYKAGLVISVI